MASSSSTTLAGTQVFIGGVAAPLLYVSSTQIGALIPSGIPSGISPRLNTTMQITSVTGMSNIVTVPTADAAPGLFSADFSGAGQGVILNQDGSLNGASNPAVAGSAVTLLGTGGGLLQNVRVTIGSVAADVLQVSAAPGQGVFLVQTRIPSRPARGTYM